MSNNFEVYLVGGAVRDRLLGRTVTEKDWVVVGAELNDLIQLGYTQVGKDFPVFLHPETKEEYALARIERKMGQGYTGFICDSSKTVTLEEDLYRRDLTINAMAQDKNGVITDPYQGQQDIEKKQLRHVSHAFTEDPLRVLRVARFAARYHYLAFSVAGETLQLMQTISQTNELSTLPPERVWRETVKALSERSPYVYFDVLHRCDAMATCFPTLSSFSVTEELQLAMKAVVEHRHQDAHLAHCSLISLALMNEGDETPTAWLSHLKAPNAAINLVTTVLKIKPYLRLPTLDGESVLALFNSTDVWRKETIFLEALNILKYAKTLCGLSKANKHIECITAMLKVAKTVTAQSVINDKVQGAQIKQAMTDKRQELICDALKLW